MRREWLRCFRGLVEEKWSFLPSSPGACLGAGGQGKVSMSAGHLEPVQESTLQTAGALGSRGDRLRATSGREACCSLSSAATEKQLPAVFPFPEPHEMASRGEGGCTHGRSECENLGLADKTQTMRRGNTRALGLL